MFHASSQPNERTQPHDRRGCIRQHSWRGQWSTAQTQQPKAPPRVEAPAEAAGQPSRPQPNWIVSCSQTRPGLECRAGQSLFLRQTRQRVLSVAVRMPADTKKPGLLNAASAWGLSRRPAPRSRLGKDEAKTLPFTTCDRGGCIVEYAISDAELAAIAKGADIAISGSRERVEEAFHPYGAGARLRRGLRQDQVTPRIGLCRGTTEARRDFSKGM